MIVAGTDIAGARVTVGVDLGGTGTRVVTLGANGDMTRHLTLPTPGGEPGAAVDTLVGAVRDISDGMQVTAVGIGASGPVTPDGVIRNSDTLPAFSDLDLCGAVSQRWGYGCVIDNDAAAAAIGESAYGAGRGSTALLVVTLGTGIGVAVVRRGQLLRAGDGSHPEAGHIAVGDAPTACYCGLADCWEQAASRTALERLMAADLADAADRARSGDAHAAAAFGRYGARVAAGLGTLLTIFRPDRVVIGGRRRSTLTCSRRRWPAASSARPATAGHHRSSRPSSAIWPARSGPPYSRVPRTGGPGRSISPGRRLGARRGEGADEFRSW